MRDERDRHERGGELSPKVGALREALRKLDITPPYGCGADDARKELARVATAAGYCPKRSVEDWARYTVAVAESVAEEPEPDVEQGTLAL